MATETLRVFLIHINHYDASSKRYKIFLENDNRKRSLDKIVLKLYSSYTSVLWYDYSNAKCISKLINLKALFKK